MNDLRKAAEMALDYIEQALAKHDQQYQRHPSTERDRQVIVNDLEALRQAITEAKEKEPKRKWVGLTDEDYPAIRDGDSSFYAGVKWAASKLKEKNT